jgi:alpha-glucosidase
MGAFSLKQILAIIRSFPLEAVLGALLYPLLQRFYEARDMPVSRPKRQEEVPSDRPLGQLVSYQRKGQAVHLMCENGLLRLDVLAEDLIRFRLLPLPTDERPAEPPFSYALDPDINWPPVAFEVEKDREAVTVRTARLTCRMTLSPFDLSFLDASDQALSEAADGLGFRGAGAFCTRRLGEVEAIYGLGEKAFGLNLRGQSLELWNTDPHSYEPGDDPIHLSVPMLMALRQGSAYGLFFDNPGRARVDLGQARQDRLRYEVDTGELCAYFFGGPRLGTILERYTQLTGRMALPPRWMLGYHQSRWSYCPEEEVRDLATGFRQRRIPCDVIHLDIHHMDGYRIFTWDRDRFPDPEGLLADLRREGFRVISIIDPGVKVDAGYWVHDEGMARDLFCRCDIETLFRGPVWPGMCYFPDFTDAKVRAWWGGLYRSLLETGVAGFWNDMNEPAIFNGEMPHNVQHSYEGRGASHGEIHNVYGLQMARASAEGVHRLVPDGRVPVISRAGYAGLQRYALVWTGDNHSTWAHLRLGVSVCLNLGLSGIAFCGPDVGGFAGDCTGELLARWTQVGALTPFFRNHTAIGTAQQEPWAFGEPYESVCRRWIEFRYELLPYLYTAAWQSAETGLPMMRPLALAFPDDLRTYSLDDQFLLGDALLAAPVGHAGQTRRRVYLPGGPWYDFWSGERLRGEVDAEAPLERMPLYVRAGSVLTMGPVIQHTGQWPPEALHLHVYPGDGESWLYEDDGLSLNYQGGEFRLTRFVCQTEAGASLRVRREVTGPFHPGYTRFEIHVHGLQAAPQAVNVDGQQIEPIFDPEQGTVRLDLGGWTDLLIQQ